MNRLLASAAITVLTVSSPATSAAMAGETPSPTGAAVHFVNLKVGDVDHIPHNPPVTLGVVSITVEQAYESNT